MSSVQSTQLSSWSSLFTTQVTGFLVWNPHSEIIPYSWMLPVKMLVLKKQRFHYHIPLQYQLLGSSYGKTQKLFAFNFLRRILFKMDWDHSLIYIDHFSPYSKGPTNDFMGWKVLRPGSKALSRNYVLPGENQDREPPIPQAQHHCKYEENCSWMQNRHSLVGQVKQMIL